MSWIATRRPIAPAALLLLALAAGCGDSVNVTPPADLARRAVVASLDAWKGGQPPGPLAGTDPPVEAVDSAWRGGQKLASYEIVGEEAGDVDKRFAVRLSLFGGKAPVEARYAVIGQGPVTVYREEDYRRMLNMEDNPAEKGRRKR
jgi:hypothetical protein